MQDLLKQKLPLYLLTRIWFLANSILAVLLGLFFAIAAIINPNEDLTLPIYFGTVFIGFFLSSPSLIVLIIVNDIYKIKRIEVITIKEYITIFIILINLVYLILTLIFIDRNFNSIIFYIVTTLAGLFSFYFLTKKYFINDNNEI